MFRVETEYFDHTNSVRSLRKQRPVRRIEHYWLCDECSPFVTLTFDRIRGVVTIPLPHGTGEKTLKLVPREERAIAVETEESQGRMALHEVRK